MNLLKKLGDVLFGTPSFKIEEPKHHEPLTKEEFERRHREQEWRRRQIRAEVRPWLEQT